jgi:hypothetical protein
MIDPFPHSVLLPLGKVIIDDPIGRKVVGQPSPSAALTNEVKNRVEDVALLVSRRAPKLASSRKLLLDDVPFCLAHVARIGFVLGHPKLSTLGGLICTAKSAGMRHFFAKRTFWTGSKIIAVSLTLAA